MENEHIKLANTVYKVLEYFPESDPLKNRTKDKALAIMEHLVLVEETSGWASFQKEKIKVQLLEDIDMILGYFWIAKSQGWLNSVNFLIIANEYEKIKSKIGPIMEPISKVTVLEKNEQKAPAEQSASVLNKSTGVEEGAPVLSVIPVISELPNIQNKKEKNLSDRQKKIVEFLSKNGKGQVMNFRTILPDITKRTIRRDLDELLESGKIVRVGEFNQVFYQIGGVGQIGQVYTS